MLAVRMLCRASNTQVTQSVHRIVMRWHRNMHRASQYAVKEHMVQAQVAVIKACKQIPAAATIVHALSRSQRHPTREAISQWRGGAACAIREAMCELEEAVALESQARQEQEQQCEHLREELVELCARMSETEARDETIAQRVASRKSQVEAKSSKLRAGCVVLASWVQSCRKVQLRALVLSWAAAVGTEEREERATDVVARHRLERGLPALHLSIAVWSEALRLLGLARHDIVLKSGRVLPRPEQARQVLGELCECFHELDIQVRNSSLRIMALANQVVPGFMQAKPPPGESRQLREHLGTLEDACSATLKQCERMLQCPSWAAEEVMLAYEGAEVESLETPLRREPMTRPRWCRSPPAASGSRARSRTPPR